MKVKGKKSIKVFSGTGNVRIDIIQNSAPIKYKTDDLDEIEVKKSYVSISTKNKINIYMKSDNDFTVEIFHNGKKKRF